MFNGPILTVKLPVQLNGIANEKEVLNYGFPIREPPKHAEAVINATRNAIITVDQQVS